MGIYAKSKQNVLYGHEDFIKTHTRSECMKEFGVDYNTVNNFCNKNNIRPVSEKRGIQTPEGFCEYAQKHTITQTSRFFNINYAAVYSLLRKNDIKCIPVGQIKDSDVLINHNMRRSGLARDMIIELSKTFTYASIARVFGYSKERIRQICNEEISA